MTIANIEINSANIEDPLGETTHEEPLPTEEEYMEDIARIEKTTIGSFIPISKKEIPRVLLATFTYFLIGYTYAFMRQFKDRVVYDVLGPSSTNWLKVVVFFISVYIVTTATSLFMKFGIEKGTDYYILGMAILLSTYCIPIYFKDSVCIRGWAEELTNDKVVALRGLGILNAFLPILNHAIMVIYYVLSEVLGSTLMSFVFMTYFNDMCTPFQTTRYIRPLYIGANFSLLASGLTVSSLVTWAQKKFSASESYKIYCYSFLGLSIVLIGIYFMKKKLDSLFAVPLYHSTSEIKKAKKSKPKVTMAETIKLTLGSKLLMSMATVSLGYNFATVVASVISQHVYSAYADYLNANPSKNTTPGFIPSKSTVGMSYKAYESFLVAIVVIMLMLSPAFARAFKKFGVFLFGLVPLFLCGWSGLSSYYFASINYPFTNNDKNVFLGFKLTERTEPIFEAECNNAALNNVLIKIGKYAFYDIVKESISARIDPDNRAVYKGVFDGIATKGGKMLGSFYGILMDQFFATSDARYYTSVTAIVICVICFAWFLSVLYLHSSYKYAVANNCFLQEESVKKSKK
ncbi:hypothetical protein NUSPORA_00076 [Nucleospora cyclopteri]